MATVRKRTWVSGGEKKTKWVADYFGQDKKRHLKTFDLKREAEEWLKKTQVDVEAGVHTPDHNSLTLSEGANLWIRNKEIEGCRRATVDYCRSRVKNDIRSASIGDTKLSRITRPMVDGWFEDLAVRVSLTHAHTSLRTLKEIMGFLQRRGYVNQNVALLVKPKKLKKRKKQLGIDIPTKDEIRLLIEHARQGEQRDLLIAAAFTGMRSGELRGLHWEDVDFDDKTINVRHAADPWGTIDIPKTEAGQRPIPLAPGGIVFNTLWQKAYPLQSFDSNVIELPSSKPKGLVFQVNGKSITRHRIVKMFLDLQLKLEMTEDSDRISRSRRRHPDIKDRLEFRRRALPIIREIQAAGMTQPSEIAKELIARGIPRARGGLNWTTSAVYETVKFAKMPRYNFHALRHFAASWFIDQGFPPQRVQEIMGHSSIQITLDVYGHLFPSPEDDRQRLAAAEAKFFATNRDKL